MQPEELPRLVPAYSVGWISGKRKLIDPVPGSRFANAPRFPSGSGGLVSTADDYLRFGRMLLEGGTLGERRIISRKTVEMLTTDFLTPEQRLAPSWRGFLARIAAWASECTSSTASPDIAARAVSANTAGRARSPPPGSTIPRSG